jgi:hypothetical protein
MAWATQPLQLSGEGRVPVMVWPVTADWPLLPRCQRRFATVELGHAPTRRWSMHSRAFVVRFPNGEFEYDVRSRRAPEVGETMRRCGALWKVTTRDAQDAVVTIHVEAVDERTSGSPRTSVHDAT